MTLHIKLSYAKSAARIAATALLFPIAHLPAVLLAIAELIGILEELPSAYKGTKTQ